MNMYLLNKDEGQRTTCFEYASMAMGPARVDIRSCMHVWTSGLYLVSQTSALAH
jgi:hypothetical protein